MQEGRYSCGNMIMQIILIMTVSTNIYICWRFSGALKLALMIKFLVNIEKISAKKIICNGFFHISYIFSWNFVTFYCYLLEDFWLATSCKLNPISKGSSIYCVCKIFRKTNISYPLVLTCTFAYQRVKSYPSRHLPAQS